METKFSQGKWQIQYLGDKPKVANEEILIADVNGETKTEIIYNAKLIAAAPELLEALESVNKEFANLAKQGLQLTELHDKVKGVIKKATE